MLSVVQTPNADLEKHTGSELTQKVSLILKVQKEETKTLLN